MRLYYTDILIHAIVHPSVSKLSQVYSTDEEPIERLQLHSLETIPPHPLAEISFHGAAVLGYELLSTAISK